MNYQIDNSMLCRTPLGNLELFRIYITQYKKKSELEKLNFLLENEKLVEDIKFASEPFYNTIQRIKIPSQKNNYKINKILQSLEDYFYRSVLRTSPFGTFTATSLSKFKDPKENPFSLTNTNFIKDVDVSEEWIRKVILKIEEKDYKLLTYHLNKNLLWSKQYISNYYLSLTNHLKFSVDITKEQLLEKFLSHFSEKKFTYDSIYEYIIKEYGEVDDEVIKKFLQSLVKNEILITNVRKSLNTNNKIKSIENFMQYNNTISISDPLLKIGNLIKTYESTNKKNGIHLVEMIEQEMSTIHEANSYLKINSYTTEVVPLDIDVKAKASDLVNFIAMLDLELGYNEAIESYKDKFIESYGSYNLVNVLDLLDVKKGIGTPNGFQNPFTTYPQKIGIYTHKNIQIFKKIILSYIVQCTLEQKDILDLSRLNFSDLKKNQIKQLSSDGEISLEIIRDYNTNIKKIGIGRSCGSSSIGSIKGRFLNQYIGEEFSNLFSLIEKQNNKVICTVLENNRNPNFAEIQSSFTLWNNVLTNPYAPILNKNNLNLNDIYIGIDSSYKFYIVSKSLKKELKFVQADRLDTSFYSNPSRFLLEISREEKFSINDFINLLDMNLEYQPKLMYKNIVLKEKQWTIYKGSNIFEFIRKWNLKGYKKLIEGDQDLLVDLESPATINRLSRKIIEIDVKLEEVTEETLKYPTEEFILSFYKNEDLSIYEPKVNISNFLNEDARKIKYPLEDGWFYAKIYCKQRDMDVILKRDLFPFINKTSIKKWFFVKYVDDRFHIRLRIQFREKSCGLNFINHLNTLSRTEIISNYEIHPYVRESERYGGVNIMSAIEEYFHKDTIFALSIIDNNNFSDPEDFIPIIKDMCDMVKVDWREIIIELDNSEKNKIKKEYFSKNIHPLKYENHALKNNEVYQQRSKILIRLNNIYEQNKDYNKSEILKAMIHMFFNRVHFNQKFEEKCIVYFQTYMNAKDKYYKYNLK